MWRIKISMKESSHTKNWVLCHFFTAPSPLMITFGISNIWSLLHILMLLSSHFQQKWKSSRKQFNSVPFLARPFKIARSGLIISPWRLSVCLKLCTHLRVKPTAPKIIRQIFATHPNQNGGRSKMAAEGAMGSPRDHCARLHLDTRDGKTWAGT